MMHTAVSVLVADDDPTSRMLVAAALEGHVGSVVTAENGQAAVRALGSGSFDLAILDLDMPVLDGFGVIQHARSRAETRHLPIIVVTGRDDVVAIERAFALGATSFLCKPLNWNVFRHQVGYVLQGARGEREMRAARDEAERLAVFRRRAFAILAREVRSAVAKIAFLSGKGAEAALAEIFAAGEQLQSVLARVEHASAILTGAAPLQPRAVEAGELAAMALQKLGASGGDASGRVAVRLGPLPPVRCDPALASDALAEMLENAVRFSPPGTPVVLTAVEAPPAGIRFEVEDRGPGLPEDLLGDTAGHGFGLLIARAVVERHGGHFGVMSEPDRGTEVFLTFPAAAALTGAAGGGGSPSAPASESCAA